MGTGRRRGVTQRPVRWTASRKVPSIFLHHHLSFPTDCLAYLIGLFLSKLQNRFVFTDLAQAVKKKVWPVTD